MKELPIIGQYLQQQQEMTAVERFAQFHAEDRTTHQATHYEALLPAQPPGPGQQYAFEVNLDACSGCKACVTACHNLNGLDAQETWRAVGTVHGKKRSTEGAVAVGGRVMARPVSDIDTKSLAASTHFQQHITTACHHCIEPACMSGCPVNAYDKDPVTGIVKHLDDQCIGCQYCTYTCPYGVPQYNPDRGIVRKCDMCTGRLAVGEAPACVQACPNEAIHITLVSTAQVRAQPAAHFQVPSSPDPSYTLPTTQYKSARKFPENARGADVEQILPQSPEYPLVIMLVLTQTAVGALVGLAWLPSTERLWLAIVAITALVLTMAGLAASTFHLGRPLYAFRVVVGLRTSWLSREAVVFGGFAGLTSLCAFIACLELSSPRIVSGDPATLLKVSRSIWTFLIWTTAFMGLVGVFCSAMIYMKTPREWWMSKATLGKFFLTTLAGGLGFLAAGHAVSVWSSGIQESSVRGLWIAMIAATVAKIALEVRVLEHLKSPRLSILKKTAVLLNDHFKAWTLGRWILAGVGGVLLPVFICVAKVGSLWSVIAAVASVGFWMSGELIERHLFFRAVVPPKMPGAM